MAGQQRHPLSDPLSDGHRSPDAAVDISTASSPQALADLVMRVGSGDRHAFTELFDHFAPRIVTLLRGTGTPPAVAEELAQEAMVMVWRKASGFDGSRGAVSTWIFAIARNLRIDRYRHEGGERRGIELDLDALELTDPGATPEERSTAREREESVRGALRKLSAQQVRVLHLSFFADSSHSEIARELCLPLGTVKAQIRRALISMRRLLENAGP